MNVEQRMQLERRVVRSACQELIAQDCVLSLYYGEGDFGVTLTDSADAVVEAMHACDEEWLYVFRDGKYVGSIWLVYGNDGWDVMADMHVTIDVMLPETNKLIESLQ